MTQAPLISPGLVELTQLRVLEASSQGARLLVGSRRHPLGRTFFELTVLAHATPGMLVRRAESVGPLAPAYRLAGKNDVVVKADATAYGVAAEIYARDLGRVFRCGGSQHGMVRVNTGLTSSELAVFGCARQSGFGCAGSRHGIEKIAQGFKYTRLAEMGS